MKKIVLFFAQMLIASIVFSQLSGIYIIDPSGNEDYTTIKGAIADLKAQGINGAVTFKIVQGIYNEQLNFSGITGTSSVNTITFEPVNNAMVTITYSPTRTDSNWVVLIDGVQYLTFKNFIFTNQNTTYGRIIDIRNNSDHCAFLNNIFNGSSETAMPYNLTIIYSNQYGIDTDNNSEFLRIENNTFNNGTIALYINNYAIGGVRADSNYINNNTFNNQSYHALYLHSNKNIRVTNNNIQTNTTSIGYKGIYMSYCNNIIEIANNIINITSNQNVFAIDINNSYITNSPGLVYNNMVYVNSGAAVNGLLISNITNLKFYHNTISIVGEIAGKVVYNFGTCSGLQFKNNILYNTGGGYIFDVNNSSNFTSSDYNILYASGNNFVRFNNTNYTTIEDYQNATSLDIHSTSRIINFISANNLHLKLSMARLTQLRGAPLSEVPTDIDGDARNTSTPFIGADEITIPAPMAGIYTIGESGCDFNSFTSAINNLWLAGISDNVIFNVKPKTYTEQIIITDIIGVKPNKTVTFQSENEDASTVILQYAPTSADSNYIIQLNNARQINFKHITFTNTSTTYGRIFDIRNNSDSCGFYNNIFNGKVNSASNNNFAIIYCNQNSLGVNLNNDYITISKNTFNNGSYGLYFSSYTTSGARLEYAVIEKNIFINQSNYGIYFNGSKFLKLNNNKITMNSTLGCTGIYLATGYDILEILNNNISITSTATSTVEGININNVNAMYNTDYGIIANNMIKVNGASQVNGFRMYNLQKINIYHNTIRVNTGNALYKTNSGSNITFINNILYNEGNGYAYNINSNPFTVIDYNCLYTNGTYFAKYNTTDISSISVWGDTLAVINAESHSVIHNVLFSEIDGMHLQDNQQNLVLVGTPIAAITTDIDGDLRSLTAPFIGADEVTISTFLNNTTIHSAAVYPNPANDIINISYSLKTTDHVVIKITDISGRIINQQNYNDQLAGNYTLNIQTQNIEKGIYFVSIQNETTNLVFKIIIE